jgi:DNA-binding beta-propeller fold protein YncE
MRSSLLALLLLAACGHDHVDRSAGKPLTWEVDQAWPVLPEGVHLGAVSGVAVDADDRVYVLHRADSDFDNHELIRSPTVFVFEASSGALVDRWGADLFVVPHGIAIGPDGHVWITDTAANTVVELTRSGAVLGIHNGN